MQEPDFQHIGELIRTLFEGLPDPEPDTDAPAIHIDGARLYIFASVDHYRAAMREDSEKAQSMYADFVFLADLEAEITVASVVKDRPGIFNKDKTDFPPEFLLQSALFYVDSRD